MWQGPIGPIPGCTCGFINGYHACHLSGCELVVELPSNQPFRFEQAGRCVHTSSSRCAVAPRDE